MSLTFGAEVERPPRELVERFRFIPATVASDAMGRLNAMDGAIRPIRYPASLVGTAITVRPFVGDALAIHAAINHAEEGDVLVVDAQGNTATAAWGQLTTLAAQRRGVAGAVVDGVGRDRRDILDAGFSLFCRGFTPAGPQLGSGGVINRPIQCGRVMVHPGDIVIGDDDGVVVVPRLEAEAVLRRAEARLQREEEWSARLRAGESNLDILGIRGIVEGPA